jgi:hypothetical protein
VVDLLFSKKDFETKNFRKEEIREMGLSIMDERLQEAMRLLRLRQFTLQDDGSLCIPLYSGGEVLIKHDGNGNYDITVNSPEGKELGSSTLQYDTLMQRYTGVVGHLDASETLPFKSVLALGMEIEALKPEIALL